jgi:hypothetical protein
MMMTRKGDVCIFCYGNSAHMALVSSLSLLQYFECMIKTFLINIS